MGASHQPVYYYYSYWYRRWGRGSRSHTGSDSSLRVSSLRRTSRCLSSCDRLPRSHMGAVRMDQTLRKGKHCQSIFNNYVYHLCAIVLRGSETFSIRHRVLFRGRIRSSLRLDIRRVNYVYDYVQLNMFQCELLVTTTTTANCKCYVIRTCDEIHIQVSTVKL